MIEMTGMIVVFIFLLPSIFISIGLATSILSHKVGRFFVNIGYVITFIYIIVTFFTLVILSVICTL